MQFEGSEKKLEVMVKSSAGDLRHRGEDFWHQLVRSVGAQVLSLLRQPHCDAYLLSESSLFVWKDKFTMITCGDTNLVQALQTFQQDVPNEQIEFFFYKRKNEYFPYLQKTNFISDLQALRSWGPGVASRLGQAGEHHVFLYHPDRVFQPQSQGVITELLMHHIAEPTRELFRSTQSKIRKALELERLFPAYVWDDHVFASGGYSINGLKDQSYITLHVTPQEDGSYASFETNAEFKEGLIPILRQMMDRFRPRSFDLITFRPENRPLELLWPDYWCVQCVQEKLKCGSYVHYASHYQTQTAIQSLRGIEV